MNNNIGHYIMFQLIKIISVSTIHILILLIIAPIIDQAFTPLNKDESNMEILFEIIMQLLTISVLWHLLERFILHTINKYFNLHKVKMVTTIMDIVSAIVLIGLQTHLISKLEYITHEHPFRLI